MDGLNSSNRICLTFRDVSLERLYTALFRLFSIYSDYSFTIARCNTFYELNFKAWRSN